MVKCPLCEKEFDSKQKLAGHRRYVHPVGMKTKGEAPMPEEAIGESGAADPSEEPDVNPSTDPSPLVYMSDNVMHHERDFPLPPPPPPQPDMKDIIQSVLTTALPILLEQMSERMAKEREAILAQGRAELGEAVDSIAKVLESLTAKEGNGAGEDNSWRAALLSIFAPKPDNQGNIMAQLQQLKEIANVFTAPLQEAHDRGFNLASNLILLASKTGLDPGAAAQAANTLVPSGKKTP